jgi:hypothetical protein
MKSRQQKRIEAEIRQAEYNSLTDKEKLDRIKRQRGESKRQKQRLGNKFPFCVRKD